MRYAAPVLLCSALGCGGGSSPVQIDASASADARVTDARVADARQDVDGPCPLRLGMTITRHHPDLTAIARRGDRIVAVGAESAILARDPDGECFTSSGGSLGLSAIIVDGSRFVAGADDDVYVSDDGKTWMEAQGSAPRDVEDIVHYGEHLVFVSSDRAVWTRDATGMFTKRFDSERGLLAIAASPNNLVAVGEYGAALVSTDAITWEPVTTNLSRHVLDVAHGAAGYVAVSESPVTPNTIVGHSPDGMTWTTSQVSGIDLRSIAFGAGTYVAVGRDGAIQASPDGTTWTARTSNTTHHLRSIEHDGTSFLVAGDHGTILESIDGITWTTLRAGDPTDLTSVAFSNGFVASTSRGVMTSSDGLTWSEIAVPGNPPLADIAVAAGRFVAVGGDTAPVIVTSIDGVTWDSIAVTGANPLRAVAHGSAGWIAVGRSGDVFVSADGIDWTPGNVGVAQQLEDIAFAGNTYVAIGSGADVHVTTDGISWVPDGVPGATNLSGIGNLGATLVATNGVDAFLSTDGMTWTTRDILTFNGFTHMSAGLEKAIGFGGTGRLFVSSDGVGWTAHDLDISMGLDAIADGNDRWLFVGSGGLVITGPTAATPF